LLSHGGHGNIETELETFEVLISLAVRERQGANAWFMQDGQFEESWGQVFVCLTIKLYEANMKEYGHKYISQPH